MKMGALRGDARNRARNGAMRKRVEGLNISAGWEGEERPKKRKEEKEKEKEKK